MKATAACACRPKATSPTTTHQLIMFDLFFYLPEPKEIRIAFVYHSQFKKHRITNRQAMEGYAQNPMRPCFLPLRRSMRRSCSHNAMCTAPNSQSPEALGSAPMQRMGGESFHKRPFPGPLVPVHFARRNSV